MLHHSISERTERVNARVTDFRSTVVLEKDPWIADGYFQMQLAVENCQLTAKIDSRLFVFKFTEKNPDRVACALLRQGDMVKVTKFLNGYALKGVRYDNISYVWGEPLP